MGILSRYLLLRTTGRFLLLLLVFLGIIAGGQIALFIGKGVPPDALVPALLGMGLLAMPIALPLAMTTAVLVTMGTLQRDGELRALAAVGISPVNITARLAPLIAFGVITAALLSHLAMPIAMRSFRENVSRSAQAAMAYRVASHKSILSEADTSVYARAAAGKELEDLYLFGNSQGSAVVAHAKRARWYLGQQGRDEGMGLDLRDVTMVRQDSDGAVLVAQNRNSIQYPVLNRLAKGGNSDADTWSTPKLIETINAWQPGDPRATLNNAQLSLQLRLFMPVAVAIFAVFAAGLALALGTADLLTGVFIVVLIVALATVPAVQYVKTSVSHPLLNPGWLLWPPAFVLLGLGAWMLTRTEQAHELIARPLAWMGKPLAWIRTGLRLIAFHLFYRGRLRRLGIDGLAERTMPAARMMLPKALGTLDRYVLVRCISRWLAVMILGTFLLLVGEFIGQNSYYVRSLAKQPLLVGYYFLLRLPEFASLWLPSSLGVAGLLVAGPMLRQGSLIALAATGVSQARVFAALIPFALLVGLVGVALDDQLMPRLRPLIDATETRMSRSGPTASGIPSRPAGWRSGPVFWSAQGARPVLGSFDRVAIFDGRPEKPIAALADRLEWQNDGWRLRNVVVCDPAGLRRIADCTPREAGFDFDWSVAGLAVELRPDQTKTSNQLLRHSPGARSWSIIVSRWMWLLAPLTGLAMVLPLFTRWENRQRLGTVSATAAVLLIIPLASLAGMQRVLITSPESAVLLSLLTVIALTAFSAWRWLRMRV